ncbi:Serine/threonine protein kinase [Gracilaria domingensis]|nr:Serine/threonine protein kinase [Gracilaria domingensis]
MGYFRVGKYIIKKKIGEGAFAEVRIAVHQESGEKFAVKIFDKARFPRPDFENDIRKEIRIMTYLNHPNIVRMNTVLVTPTKIYIVMELVTGGELYEEIVRNRRLDEATSRKYFQQIVDALVYCHRRGVVHRDLKPENLLLDNYGNIKITDFGMSWMRDAIDPEVHSKQLLKTQCGTPKYMAPEIILRAPDGYDGEKIDAWECGVVLFALLAGYLPFRGDDDVSVFQSVLRGEVVFPDHFPPMACDVISKLLQKDPSQRASLHEIRNHPWFLKDYKGKEQHAWMMATAAMNQSYLNIHSNSRPNVGDADRDDVGDLTAATRRQLSMRLTHQLPVTRETQFKETQRRSKANLHRVQNGSISNRTRRSRAGMRLTEKFKDGTLVLQESKTGGKELALRPKPKGRPKPNLSLAGLSTLDNDETELHEIVCLPGENVFSPREQEDSRSITESGLPFHKTNPQRSKLGPFSLKPLRLKDVDNDGENPVSFRDLLKSPFGAVVRSLRNVGAQETDSSNPGRPDDLEPSSRGKVFGTLFADSPTSVSSPRAAILRLRSRPAKRKKSFEGQTPPNATKVSTDSTDNFCQRTQESPEDVQAPPSSSFKKLAAFLSKKGK